MREQEDRTQLKHSTLFANCRKFHAIKAPLSMWIILTLISPCCLAQDSQDSTSLHSLHSLQCSRRTPFHSTPRWQSICFGEP